MVVAKQKEVLQVNTKIDTQSVDLPDEEIKWCTVSLFEILQKNNRLEASAFSLEAKHARELLLNSKYDTIPLFSTVGFTRNAFYPGRFKRNYVDKNATNAIGFLGSSEMLNIKPEPVKFLNSKQEDLENLFVEDNDILLSRSGVKPPIFGPKLKLVFDDFLAA